MIKQRLRKRDNRRVYDVRLRDPAGKEYGRTFETKKEAQDFEAGERTVRRRGAWIDPRRAEITFADLAGRWLSSNPAKRSGSSETDRFNLQHALSVLGSQPVGSITRADIQRLVDTWRMTHAASTVARMYSTTRAVFSYAEASEIILRSPCRHVRLPPIPRLRRPNLSADDLDRLAGELGPAQAAMMRMSLVTSGRWAECAGLQVGGVDPLGGKLTIALQLDRRRQLVDTKTEAGKRTMAVPRWLLEDLAALLAERGLSAADGEELVFVNSLGRPWSYSAWRRSVWLPATKRAGLPGVGFHDLRRANASAMVVNNIDVKTAQTRFGHDTPGLMLELYAAADETADQEAAEKIGEVFGPRGNRGIDRKRKDRGAAE